MGNQLGGLPQLSRLLVVTVEQMGRTKGKFRVAVDHAGVSAVEVAHRQLGVANDLADIVEGHKNPGVVDFTQQEGAVILADVLGVQEMLLQMLQVKFQFTPGRGRLTEGLDTDMAQGGQGIAECRGGGQSLKDFVDLGEVGELNIPPLHAVQILEDFLHLAGAVEIIVGQNPLSVV